MMASVIQSLFVPSIYFAIIFYAILVFLNDVAFTCSVATLGLIVSLIFLLNFSLPPNDKTKMEMFLTSQDQMFENGGDSNVNNEVTRNCQKITIVAHRTLALDAPENSESGIIQTSENGFDAVEFDVRLSKDGIPVLFHDATIDRITSARGNVADLTLSELKELDISTNHLKHNHFEGEKVLTLAEAIAKCLHLQLKIFIEVKVTDQRILTSLLELYETNPELYDQAIVISFSPFFLYQLRRKDPCILTGLVWRPKMVSIRCPSGLLDHGSPGYREMWKNALANVADRIVDFTYHSLLWYLCGAAAILAHKDGISREYLRIWKQRGIEVLAWPVNDPVEKLYFENVLKIGYLTDTCLPHY